MILASGTTIKAMKKASPGQTVTFDGLATGSYVVALEGFLADAVQYYGQTSVQVEAGKNNSAAVTFTSFQPALNPQDVARGVTVTLDGRGGRTETLTYNWTQTSGTSVGALSGSQPSFTAPNEVTTLAFTLVVTDPYGHQSAPGQVTVFVLENPAAAVWVARTGNDASPGTRASPMATIQAAIDRANAAGNGADIYVAGGTYAQGLTLRTQISVYGGFSAASWLRDITANVTVVNGPATAVIGNGASSLTLDGLTISASNATAGGSSIAISLVSSSNVVISRNAITAGVGADGANGSDGVPGLPGNQGANGVDARSGCVTGIGGAGGAGPGFNGGAGGGGKTGVGDAGVPGAGPIGGSGGSGGGIGVDGQPGHPVTFEAGAGPSGASSTLDFGAVTATGGYIPASGAPGGGGKPGSGGGGGGGGGGGVFAASCGGGGGGGGAGGAGAGGGGAGVGGGGSLGIMVTNGSTNVTISATTITTGNGGKGGTGGADSRAPGSGGAGGPSGIGVNGSGAGGPGGAGGLGGFGGSGGGGSGGPSIGVVEDASSGTNVTASNFAGNTFTLGTAGVGGAHGTSGGISGGSPGATGARVEYRKLP